MIPLVIAAGVSAASSIAGGIAANKKRKMAEKQLQAQNRRLDEWYSAEMGQDYLDRADSRAMLKRIRDYNSETLDSMNTNAIKAGASDEAKVAAANRMNRNYSQAVADIAGMGERRKDSIRSQYMGQKSELDNMLYQSKLSEANGMQQMISNIGQASGALASAYGSKSAAPIKTQSLDPVNSSGIKSVSSGIKPLNLGKIKLYGIK